MRQLISFIFMTMLTLSALFFLQSDAKARLFGVGHGTKHTDPIFKDFIEREAPGSGLIMLAGTAPPTPHSAFGAYSFVFHPEHGVCTGVALSTPFGSDAYGRQVRSAIDKVANQLAKRFGAGQKIDRLDSGSSYDDPEFWAYGLHHNERVYAYQWQSVPSESQILNMYLSADSDLDSTQMGLVWNFRTVRHCDELSEKRDMEAF